MGPGDYYQQLEKNGAGVPHADPIVTGSTASTFNHAALVKSYASANKLVMDNSWTSGITNIAKAVTGNADYIGVDIDATIKGADIDTTLNAIVAGDHTLKQFADQVRQYPDLKTSLGKVMADEGKAGLEGFQDLMTGDGAVSSADLNAMLADPIKRGLMVEMLDAVATEKFDMQYAKRFVQTGMAATRDGATAKDRNEFMEVAAEAGIDPAAPYKAQAMNAFMGFFGNVMRGGDIKASMTDLTATLGAMGMSAESLQSLQNILGPLAGVMQFMFEPYVQFAQKWGPTMSEGVGNIVTDAQNIMGGMEQIGATATDRALSGAHASLEERIKATNVTYNEHFERNVERTGNTNLEQSELAMTPEALSKFGVVATDGFTPDGRMKVTVDPDQQRQLAEMDAQNTSNTFRHQQFGMA